MKNTINLIINPFQFYRDFKEKEEVKLLFPIVILLIMGVLTVFVGYRTSINMTIPDVSGAEAPMSSNMALVGAAIGGVTATVGMAMMWVIKSAVYNFIFKKMGGHGNFKRTLYITGTAAVTGIFVLVLSIIFPPKIDMTAMQQSLDLFSVIRDSFNLFVLWELFLLTVGFAIEHGLSYKKAAIPVLIFHLVSVVLSIAMALGMQGFTSNLVGGSEGANAGVTVD